MSSKRRLRRRSCEGKIAYETHEQAHKVAWKLKGRLLHAYKCQFCKKYHVGGVAKKYRHCHKKQVGTLKV